MIWIVSAFFAGAYIGAIAFGAIAAWRDAYPQRREPRVRRPPPITPWDLGPRTVTRY